LFGIMPKSMIWLFMRPFMNNLGTKMVNMAKYNMGHFSGSSTTRTPHAAYHFLLDYVPDWKKAYGSTGLIQYQPFIPRDNALDAFKEILTLCQRRKMPNYLTVLKRHRPDDFMLTHGLDGFSMAMDFRITNRNREKVVALTRELDKIVLAANGRFYLAKDSTLRPETAVAYLGQETVDSFRRLKAECDPDGLIQTNMWRRIFT
jgi:FAD/FMN-containing dehydrogenase